MREGIPALKPPVRGRGRTHPAGWALAELLTVLFLTAFFAAVLLQTVAALRGTMARWEASSRARQSLAAALFLIGRDIRMAGCDPLGGSRTPSLEILPSGSSGNGIRLRMDVRGRSAGTRPDGDSDDPDETVVYEWDEARSVLRRNRQPLAARAGRDPASPPLFRLVRRSDWGLLRVWIAAEGEPDDLCLSGAFCLRNPMD